MTTSAANVGRVAFACSSRVIDGEGSTSYARVDQESPLEYDNSPSRIDIRRGGGSGR
jgi:hypothetical protein